MRRLLSRAARVAPLETPLFVDDGNRAAADAIRRAVAGGRVPTPIVLVGPPDSGKTRLLAELSTGLAARGGSVVSGTARDWSRRVREICTVGGAEPLREDIARAEALVVDEMHRLGSAPATCEFLLHRIAERTAAGKLVAVAMRHAPRAVRGFPARAVSLLAGGLVLPVSRAGPEIRRRYLAAVSRGALDAAAIERLCEAVSGGLGALREAAREGPRRVTAGAIGIDRIAVATARELGVPAAALVGRRRTSGLVRARAAFVVAARRLGATRDQLAGALDGRRSAGMARLETSARAVANRDAALAAAIDRVVERLRGGAGA
ncbi:MAG TPA: DnaA/Hda family protein [Planctomycetota bacterium]|nr:DnaA/Hda family protein [Planctomycetota bacterium]